ncbi:MAG TPA: hypothetical protein VFA37_08040 [Gaiellaceae bacterium]|nr:hypothetical protein [Gaiellaceae bacterium]
MAKKQERVPGMREVKPNREQRRHPEGKPEDQPLARDEPAPAVPDVPDPHAKNAGKKTADNWNQ